ncbi:microsomal dipeptidase precursor [Thelonectria olida]|uniref:Dipeptidase n=1 Tax=Thelonectria olida TaxID=1576542 RepID=A0A9P8VVT9_9HYPO|nr:microsomal dipeptidase precursor [Thelonectria olida]
MSTPIELFLIALGLYGLGHRLGVTTSLGGFVSDRCDDATQTLSLKERVEVILENTPLIDGHNDLADVIRSTFNNHIYSSSFADPFVRGNLTGHVDLPRLAEGKVGGTFWSVYVDCPANVSDFSNENYAQAGVRQTSAQIDLVRRLQQKYPDVLSRPPNGTTAMDFFRSGKVISPLGMEGLHSIGNSFAQLRDFYELGVRYATLTHYCHNLFADAAVVNAPSGGLEMPEPLWNGVSENGKQVVFEMNRLGMLVDLAHVSHQTMRDVLGQGKDSWGGSKAPVIFSHSSVYALCPHPRNVPDDVLQMVKDTGSVVMVTFVPAFLSCTASQEANRLPVSDSNPATLSRVIDHIMYIGELIGYEHVGLGSDFDGIPVTPSGLDDVSYFPGLIEELLRRGVTDEDAALVAGGSLIRVWGKADEVALEMQRRGVNPVEDDETLGGNFLDQSNTV